MQELIAEVELRAGMLTNVKLTNVGIESELLEEKLWQVSTTPMTTAVTSADSVSVAELPEKITSLTTTADMPPMVAATTPANARTAVCTCAEEGERTITTTAKEE